MRPASGAFAPDAYHEEPFPVRATYAVAATRQIPTGDWILMNYQFKNSLPGQPKVTGDIEYRFDTDGDGSLDTTQTVKKYSLEYHHARTGADVDSKFSGCAGSHLEGARFAPLNSARTATAQLDRAPQPAPSSTAAPEIVAPAPSASASAMASTPPAGAALPPP